MLNILENNDENRDILTPEIISKEIVEEQRDTALKDKVERMLQKSMNELEQENDER